MKTFALYATLISLIFLYPEVLSGQTKHDISIHYGLLSSPEIFDYAGDFYSTETDLGGVSRTNPSWWGSFGGTFRYFFTDIQSVAMVIAYTQTDADLTSGNDVVGESLRDFYTLAAEWNIHFLRLKNYQMYGGGGLGVTFVFEDNSFYSPGYSSFSDSRVYPNFDFTMLGMRFGQKLGVFTEFGFGYKGVFRLGISGQF